MASRFNKKKILTVVKNQANEIIVLTLQHAYDYY